MFLTISQLRSAVKLTTTQSIELLPLINQAIREFGIDRTRERVAAFLAQVGHESLDFNFSIENLNYSAARLVEVFPTHFSIKTANEYAHQPERIANRVYANRMGNGNELSGDGWKFRGRCALQATGREMYLWLSQELALDLVKNPDLLLSREHGMRAAAAIFAKNKNCNRIADQLSGNLTTEERDVFAAITRKINGGLNGASDRWQRYTRALRALPVETPTSAVMVAPLAEAPESVPPATTVIAPPITAPLITEAVPTPPDSLKDFTTKYLKHCPTDHLRNIAFIVTGRVAAGVSFAFSFGLPAQILTVVAILALIAPVIYAVYYYRARLWAWIKQIFEGLTGE